MPSTGSPHIALALACGAGFSTSIGASVVFVTRWVTAINKRFLAAALTLSAGVMLIVSMTELWEEALSGFHESGFSKGDSLLFTVTGFFAGCGLVVLLDRFVHSLEEAKSLSDWCGRLAYVATGLLRLRPSTTTTTTAVLESARSEPSRSAAVGDNTAISRRGSVVEVELPTATTRLTSGRKPQRAPYSDAPAVGSRLSSNRTLTTSSYKQSQLQSQPAAIASSRPVTGSRSEETSAAVSAASTPTVAPLLGADDGRHAPVYVVTSTSDSDRGILSSTRNHNNTAAGTGLASSGDGRSNKDDVQSVSSSAPSSLGVRPSNPYDTVAAGSHATLASQSLSAECGRCGNLVVFAGPQLDRVYHSERAEHTLFDVLGEGLSENGNKSSSSRDTDTGHLRSSSDIQQVDSEGHRDAAAAHARNGSRLTIASDVPLVEALSSPVALIRGSSGDDDGGKHATGTGSDSGSGGAFDHRGHSHHHNHHQKHQPHPHSHGHGHGVTSHFVDFDTLSSQSQQTTQHVALSVTGDGPRDSSNSSDRLQPKDEAGGVHVEDGKRHHHHRRAASEFSSSSSAIYEPETSAQSDARLNKLGLLAALAICLHNFPEGA